MESQLSQVVDALPGLVWTAQPDGEVDFVNQRWREYTGISSDDAAGWAWQSAIHPDDLPGLLDHWRFLLQSRKPGEFEVRLRRSDGVFRWFLIRVLPSRDEHGQVLKWYGQNVDIEDRKRAESLLAGEKRLLEMVARGSSLTEVLEALCRFVESATPDSHCSILLAEPGAPRLQFGAAPSLPASLVDAVVSLPLSPDSGACSSAICLNRQVIAADIMSETRWQSSGWCTVALQHGVRACWSTPISSRNGQVLGSFAILYREPRTPTTLHQNLIGRFTHIASIAIERSQSDAALKRSEEFLAKAQQVSSTGGFYWRPATREVIWSEQVYRIFELDPAVPVTLELILSRLHPEDIPAFEEMLDRQLRDGTDFEHGHRLLLPDRSVKHLHVVAQATRDHDGSLLYVAAVQDVTQQRRSEEALGKLRSELAHMARVTTLGALTASIAHEVNQPLSGILTNACTGLRMLSAHPPNIEGARETARRTIRDANRAADVITRLRGLFAKKDFTTELVDLNEATREVVALAASELNRSRVVLRTELAEDLPPAMGDRIQLQQVILNLLLNASEAMSGVDDRPRQLVIRTEPEGGKQVRLSVQDVGVGLNSESMDKLFQAFYTTKPEGMGMGLSISRSIIESHQGRLWAGPNDGPGATFSFSIPSGSKGMAGAPSIGAIQASTRSDAGHAVAST
jgi:PAS domain S-box-containing protein